jgi:hypothetical protein
LAISPNNPNCFYGSELQPILFLATVSCPQVKS